MTESETITTCATSAFFQIAFNLGGLGHFQSLREWGGGNTKAMRKHTFRPWH